MAKKSTQPNDGTALVKKDLDGASVEFTDTDVQDLNLFEQAIVSSWIQEAVALRNIANRKLYLLRDCVSMKDYLMEYYKKSYSHANRLLYLTSKINTERLPDFNGIPMTRLLEISKDDALVGMINDGDASVEIDRVIYSDGTTESLSDLIARTKREAKREEGQDRDKLQKKIDKQKEILDGKSHMLERLYEQLEESKTHTRQLEESLQSLISEKGIDPKTIVFITHKKQAVDLIDETRREILKSLGAIDNIPKDLVDAEIGGMLGLTIAAIDAASERIRDNWGAVLWLPGQSEKPHDLVP